MEKLQIKYGETNLPYFRKGDNPTWLVHSGTHGDESGVISSVQKYLEANESRLPPFIWVPEVSPSAVRLGTRKNIRGLDLNRNFLDESPEEEIQTNLELIRNKKFDVFLTFHEDPTTDKFYLYDSLDISGTGELRSLYSKIESLGVGFYNDIDDPELGLEIKDGYFSWKWVKEPKMDKGLIEDYLESHNVVRSRILNPEIPGKVSQEIKDEITYILFDYLIQRVR